MKFLEGKKTYLGAVAFAVLGVLLGSNLITRDQFESLAALVTAWTAYGLRDAIK